MRISFPLLIDLLRKQKESSRYPPYPPPHVEGEPSPVQRIAYLFKSDFRREITIFSVHKQYGVLRRRNSKYGFTNQLE